MSSISQSAINSTDFSYLCRLCLGNDEEDMEEIFPLSEKIEFVTRMAVTVGDGLPTFVCQHCVFELDSAHNFISRCIANGSLFRSKHLMPCPDYSYHVKEEILEDNPDHVIDHQSTNYENIDNQDKDGQNIDYYDDDLVVTHSTVVRTDSLPDPEPVCEEMFGAVNIIQPPVNAFVTEEALVTEQPIKKPRTRAKPVKMYTCELCDESFNMKVYFNLHMRSHVMYAPSKSGTPEKVNDTESRKAKKVNNVAQKNLSCRFCGRSFVREGSLKTHELTHGVTKRTYDCTKCLKKFHSEFRLKLHVQNHHRTQKPSLKAKAVKRVPVKKNVVRKQKVSAGRSPATSKERPKASVKTKSPSASRGSKRTVVKPNELRAPTFPCLTCDKTFSSNRSMLMHAKFHKDKPTPATFPCATCSKVFPTKKSMLAHASSHAKALAYKCVRCGKRFAEKASLKLHATSHAKLGRFKCGKCGEEFGSRLHLTHHKRFHADEKPYKCSECGVGFVDEVSLLCHFVVHANKPVEFSEEDASVERAESPEVKTKVAGSCAVCGREFTRKAALVKHMRSHELRKCSKCGEEFETQRLLAEHLPFHNEDNPYKCAECESEFAEELAFFEHFKCHVKVETAD